MPRLGRKQHRVTPADELVQLDVHAVCAERTGERGRLLRVGNTVGGAMGKQDLAVTKYRNRLPSRQPTLRTLA
jgi:hypothetical protein